MRRRCRALVLSFLFAAPSVLAGACQQRDQIEPGEGGVQFQYRDNGLTRGGGRDDFANTGPEMRANRPTIWP
jgi:hypothetical protein